MLISPHLHHLNTIRGNLGVNGYDTSADYMTSEEAMVRHLAEDRLRMVAYGWAVELPKVVPDEYKPQDEEKLYQKLCALIKTDEETM